MISFDAVFAEAKAAIATFQRIEKILAEINTKLDAILDRLPADLGQGE